MEPLTIITPCSRPYNLPMLAASIEPGRKLFAITWRVVFDGARLKWHEVPGAVAEIATHAESQFGNHQRNYGLMATQEGWVYFLDDDTVMHPDFFTGLNAAIRQHPGARGFAFPQIKRKRIRGAAAETMKVRMVDMGQVCMQRGLIGATRFELGLYEADGVFIENVYESDPQGWVFLNTPVCTYNSLR